MKENYHHKILMKIVLTATALIRQARRDFTEFHPADSVGPHPVDKANL